MPHQSAANQPAVYLEVEDAGVSLVELLVMRDDSGQGVFFEGQGGNGSQEPTVPCGDKTGASWVNERNMKTHKATPADNLSEPTQLSLANVRPVCIADDEPRVVGEFLCGNRKRTG